ncbi:MAG: hypothetical protein E6P95_00625 [Candidatus Moraniibacteriota bacterium]|nr:MAG: hypothetical protein E6P95_00625 [Candidatus Moranbacteria bacterium]
MEKKFIILGGLLFFVLTLAIVMHFYVLQLPRPLDPGTQLADPETARCVHSATQTAREMSQAESGDYYAEIWKKTFDDCSRK